MKQELLVKTTILGFDDITQYLNEDYIIKIKKNDIIRNILVDRITEEIHDKNKVKIGFFFSKEKEIRGRVFTFSELIEPMKNYDLIVQNQKIEENTFPRYNLDTQIYHDLYNGERIKVYAEKRDEGDPSFLLFNRIRGFIHKTWNRDVYNKIRTGDLVLIQINRLRKKDNKYFVSAEPVEILRNNNQA